MPLPTWLQAELVISGSSVFIVELFFSRFLGRTSSVQSILLATYTPGATLRASSGRSGRSRFLFGAPDTKCAPSLPDGRMPYIFACESHLVVFLFLGTG